MLFLPDKHVLWLSQHILPQAQMCKFTLIIEELDEIVQIKG